jgi:hypothetical protein
METNSAEVFLLFYSPMVLHQIWYSAFHTQDVVPNTIMVTLEIYALLHYTIIGERERANPVVSSSGFFYLFIVPTSCKCACAVSLRDSKYAKRNEISQWSVLLLYAYTRRVVGQPHRLLPSCQLPGGPRHWQTNWKRKVGTVLLTCSPLWQYTARM